MEFSQLFSEGDVIDGTVIDNQHNKVMDESCELFGKLAFGNSDEEFQELSVM